MIVIFLQMLVWTAFIAAVILWPAGTLAYPGAWAFVALFALGGFARHVACPSTVRACCASAWPHRCSATKSHGIAFSWCSSCSLRRLAGVHGLGRRPHGLHRGAALAAGARRHWHGGLMLGAWWTFRENAFAAPVVKIQEGQRVIDTGPYAIVRHPMYASALFLFVGVPLLLGSWLGLAFPRSSSSPSPGAPCRRSASCAPSCWLRGLCCARALPLHSVRLVKVEGREVCGEGRSAR